MAELVAPQDRLRDRPGAWIDLGLTLPIWNRNQLGIAEASRWIR